MSGGIRATPVEQQREEQKRREKEAEERQRAEERCVLRGRALRAWVHASVPSETQQDCGACGLPPGHRRLPTRPSR